MIDEDTIRYGDVDHMATVPVQRPTFMLLGDEYPIRIVGLLICYGKKFDYNVEPFASFPIDEDGIIHFSDDCNNGSGTLFHGPLVHSSLFYRETMSKYCKAYDNDEKEFIRYCNEIGLEIVY